MDIWNRGYEKFKTPYNPEGRRMMGRAGAELAQHCQGSCVRSFDKIWISSFHKLSVLSLWLFIIAQSNFFFHVACLLLLLHLPRLVIVDMRLEFNPTLFHRFDADGDKFVPNSFSPFVRVCLSFVCPISIDRCL